jgi:hypothetical protein
MKTCRSEPSSASGRFYARRVFKLLENGGRPPFWMLCNRGASIEPIQFLGGFAPTYAAAQDGRQYYGRAHFGSPWDHVTRWLCRMASQRSQHLTTRTLNRALPPGTR